jgi:type VI secretion system protein ImpI
MDALRLHVTRGSVTSSLLFQRFPVRLGRDETNDCRLDFAFVSRSHASLALDKGRLVLRDEGSKSGTWVRGGSVRLEAGRSMELGGVGDEFRIGTLRFRAELVRDEEDLQPTQEKLESVDSEDFQTRHYDEGRVDPAALESEAVEASLRASLAQCAAANRALVDVLRTARGGSSEHLKHLAEIVVAAEPEWDGRAALRHFVAASGLRPAPARLDDTALRVLQELAAFYVPYAPPLSGSEAVVEFGQRVDDLLSAVADGLEALGRAHHAATTAARDPDARSRPERLALWLDWTRDNAGIRALRAEFARVATLHGKLTATWQERTKAVRPEQIEADCGCPSSWAPWRYALLWREYVRRFAAEERAIGEQGAPGAPPLPKRSGEVTETAATPCGGPT